MLDAPIFGRTKASHLCILFLVLLNTVFHIQNYHRNLIESNNERTNPTSTASISTSTPKHNSDELLVQYGDSIYTQLDWDGAPVVIEQYKLLFFTSPKVGCTTWKQLFRRMMNVTNYMEEEYERLLPWNPEINGLKYLYHYNRTTASSMMTDPTWTRAIFVRDPKERFLSAYLDKVVQNENYVIRRCCPYGRKCGTKAKESIANFLHLMRICTDSHWNPQSKRILEDKYWPYINFVGHMEHLYDDAKLLLQRLGAWDEYGKSGWGATRTDAIFQSKAGGTGRLHATDAVSKMKAYITPEIEKELEQYYADDYNNTIFHINLKKIYSDEVR
jgi:Sulfotransferase family